MLFSVRLARRCAGVVAVESSITSMLAADVKNAQTLAARECRALNLNSELRTGIAGNVGQDAPHRKRTFPSSERDRRC